MFTSHTVSNTRSSNLIFINLKGKSSITGSILIPFNYLWGGVSFPVYWSLVFSLLWTGYLYFVHFSIILSKLAPTRVSCFENIFPWPIISLLTLSTAYLFTKKCSICMYSWPLNNVEGWSVHKLVCESSATLDSTNHRPCAVLSIYYWKIPTYKWACAVQTRTVPRVNCTTVCQSFPYLTLDLMIGLKTAFSSAHPPLPQYKFPSQSSTVIVGISFTFKYLIWNFHIRCKLEGSNFFLPGGQLCHTIYSFFLVN